MHNQTVQHPFGADPAPEATGQVPQPSAAARPVFVDPSGRRQRRVRRFGRLLAIPAAGYVALLLSAALGGPSVDSPYLPLPAAGEHTGATTGPAAPGDGPSAPAHRKGAAPAPGSDTARPGQSGTAGVPSSAPASTAGTSPTAPSSTASAAPSPTAVPTTTHGRSTATHPVPTHTGHGR